MSENIQIHIGSKQYNLNFIGNCMWGGMYKAINEPFFFRLIPYRLIQTLEVRKSLQKLADLPHYRNIAHVGEVELVEINKTSYISIRYDVLCDYTLITVLSQHNPPQCIAAYVKILNVMTDWWLNVGEGIIPMPADIVFVNEVPYLLAFPGMKFLGLPKIEDLVSYPDRMYYLGNEVFRGRAESKFTGARTLDLYALGFSILFGIYNFKLSSDPEVIFRQKSGKDFLVAPEYDRPLPFWFNKVAQIQAIFNFINELTDPNVINRASVEPDKLANYLNEKISYFSPDYVVEELLNDKKPEMAVSLLQDIVLNDSSLKYQIKAGEIARDYLHDPLEAIELFESAIQKSPASNPAYLKQLETILDYKTLLEVILGLSNKKNLHEKLDLIFKRNFEQVSLDNRKKFVNQIAGYYLSINQSEYSAKLIYPFLFEGTKYLWYEFEKIFIYIKALLGQNRSNDAIRLFDDTKKNFLNAKQENKIRAKDVQAIGGTITEIERVLLPFRNKIN